MLCNISSPYDSLFPDVLLNKHTEGGTRSDIEVLLVSFFFLKVFCVIYSLPGCTAAVAWPSSLCNSQENF